MTYNIHGGLDRLGRPSLPQLGATIALSGAGLAGLQEVEREFWPRAGHADQPALLAARLGQDFRFAAGIDLRPGEPGGKFGNAILSAWPIVAAWSLPLPSRGEGRVLLGAAIEAPCGRFNFLTCHLGLDHGERREQVEAVLARTAELWGPVMLAGDFNARPDAPELAPLFDVYQEVQTARGMDRPTYPAAEARIDYLFCSRDLEVRQAWVVPSPASDHWPVVAEVGPGSGGERE